MEETSLWFLTGQCDLQLRKALPMNLNPGLLFFFFNDFFLKNLHFGCTGPHCCMRAFSSRSEQGLLFTAVHGLAVAASRCRAPALAVAVCWLSSCTGSVASPPVASSGTRDGTCVLCASRRILIHSATREVLLFLTKVCFSQ